MRFLCIFIIMIFLSGCGGGGFFGGDRGRVDPFYGYYKVGKPYKVSGRWYYPQVDYDYDEMGIASWYGEAFHGKRTANGATFDMDKVSAAHKTLPLPSYVEVTNLDNGKVLKLVINDRGPYVAGRIIDLSRAAAERLEFRKKGTANVRVRVLAGESGLLASRLQQGKWDDLVESGRLPSASPTAEVTSGDLVSLDGADSSDSVSDSGSGGGVSVIASAEASSGGESWDLSAGDIAEGLSGSVEAGGYQVYIQVGAFREYGNALRVQRVLDDLATARILQLDRGNYPLFRVRLGPFVDTAEVDMMLALMRNEGYNDARVVIVSDDDVS